MNPRVYSFEGIVPVIDPSAFVHPSAVLIGDVIIGPRCFVGACATLRGDFGRIELRAEANFQDNCVAHSLPDFDCVMDERSHIGHGAIVHACRIGRGALIGMNAVVMDRAQVGEYAIVAAMSFVKIGGQIPARMLATGIPARVVRELSEQDLARKSAGTDDYVALAARSKAGMFAVDALPAVEPGRRRSDWSKP